MPAKQINSQGVWTSLRVEERGRELCAKYPAREAARLLSRELGTPVTKNQIIGKARRAGWAMCNPPRGSVLSAIDAKVQRRSPAPRREQPPKLRKRVSRPMKQIEPAPGSDTTPVPHQPGPLPGARYPDGMLLRDRRFNMQTHCRFTVRTELSSSLMPLHYYCAEMRLDGYRNPYCPTHVRMMYKPQKPR